MAVNKVMDSVGNVLLDLTGDTVTPDKVLQGYTFHNRSGQVQTGTAVQDAHGVPHEDWVMFFDYDGTLVETWTYEELQQASTLPNGPNHTNENLTFDEWNYTLEDLLEQDCPTVVGAIYYTTDGATDIEIEIIRSQYKTISLYVNGNAATFTVSWGDGTSTVETTLNKGASTYIQHEYSDKGTYLIKITSSDTYYLGDTNSSNMLIGNYTTYGYCLKNIRISSNAKVRQYFANHARYLQKISFPKNMSIASCSYGFQETISLKAFIIPRGATILPVEMMSSNAMGGAIVVSIPNTVITIKSSCFGYCPCLRYISIPKSVQTFGTSIFTACSALQTPITVEKLSTSMFNGCSNLRRIAIRNLSNLDSVSTGTLSGTWSLLDLDIIVPYGITSLYAFHQARLHKLTVPSSVQSISVSLIYIQIIDLSSHETPPTLSNYSNVYAQNTPSRIIVARGTLPLYAAATNWSTVYTYGVLEEATE